MLKFYDPDLDEITCLYCGEPLHLTSVMSNKKYCSIRCRQLHYKERTQKGQVNYVPKNEKHLICSLIAQSDLMQKGYFVFKPINRHRPCDLIILNQDGEVFLVEVSSAQYNEISGKVLTPNRRHPNADIWIKVIVRENGEHDLIYEPEL